MQHIECKGRCAQSIGDVRRPIGVVRKSIGELSRTMGEDLGRINNTLALSLENWRPKLSMLGLTSNLQDD